MPIAALDAGGAPPPAAPDAVQSNPVRLAWRMSAHRKRKLGHGRKLRRIGLEFAVFVLAYFLG